MSDFPIGKVLGLSHPWGKMGISTEWLYVLFRGCPLLIESKRTSFLGSCPTPHPHLRAHTHTQILCSKPTGNSGNPVLLEVTLGNRKPTSVRVESGEQLESAKPVRQSFDTAHGVALADQRLTFWTFCYVASVPLHFPSLVMVCPCFITCIS